MPTINDLISGLAAQMAGGAEGGGAPPNTIEQLKALQQSRAPMGNQIGGKNTGGRHNPDQGAVYADDSGNQRLMQPPSVGRTAPAGNRNKVTDQLPPDPEIEALNTVGDSIGGTDLTSLAQNPQALIKAGAMAIDRLAKGQATPEDKKLVTDFIRAVQGGAIQRTPQMGQLMDKMKRAKMLNSANNPQY